MPAQPAGPLPGHGRDGGDDWLALATVDDGWEPPPEPTDDDLDDQWPDPYAGPPDGDDAWLAGLASGQFAALAAELAARRPPPRAAVPAGFTHRQAASDAAGGGPGRDDVPAGCGPPDPGSGSSPEGRWTSRRPGRCSPPWPRTPSTAA